MDLDLQMKVTEILKQTLVDAQRAKLQGLGRNEEPISLKTLFQSMVTSNRIPVRQIMEASPDSYTANITRYVLEAAPDSIKQIFAAETPPTTDTWSEITEGLKEVVNSGIESGKLSSVQMLLTLYELGVITADEQYLARIMSGNISPLNVILEKLDSGEITPQMTYLDPCTASAVLVEVGTGNVLAAVGYPSYDNNELANDMNSAYYNALIADEYTVPLNNRPFREPRAPGSTFKMITAIAGLETGVISPTTTIYDGHSFTKAGWPFTNCWSSVSHGSINVTNALEVSCNYFFCEMAYRLGNSTNGNSLDGINVLNQYMKYFGLNERTGVEIGELYDDTYYSEAPSVISSPEFKRYKNIKRYAEPRPIDLEWYDGDSVKTAIGQADNNYTAASMAKYIATIATRGTRYQFHLVDRVETQQGALVRQVEPVIEDNSNVTVSEETWDLIYQGMQNVVEGRNGTGRNTFSSFPVKVAGKTGTAEEDKTRRDHSSFGGFAPYDDPEIAVYVVIPFGDTRAYASAASQAARKIIAAYMGLDSQPQPAAVPNALAQ
jgi:cell division protein FtsI/penicillin-binding protein 2